MPYYSPTTATIQRRKSPPTCTLSLAHVSAAPKFHSQPKSSVKVKNAELNLSTMQVELQVDFSSVITVPVHVHVGDSSAHGPSSASSPSLRRSKSKKRIHLKRSEINVIPFPSATYSSPDNPLVQKISSPSTPHVLLRSSNPDLQLHSSSAIGSTRRARKGTVNASVSISTSVRSTLRTSPSKNGSRLSSSTFQTHNASQLPPRPSSPTPKPLTQALLQDKIQQLKTEDSFEPPPYSSPPPPYSPSLESAVTADPKSAPPSTPSSPASSLPKSSRVPIASSTQTQSRRSRASSSELKTLLFLYHTIMYGIERRHRLESLKKQQRPAASQPFSPGTSPSRSSEIHFGRFPLVEEDENDADADAEDDDDHPIFGGSRPRPGAPHMQRKQSSKSPAERAAKDFDVQDALLAIRLRVFLKSHGVSEDELAVHFDEEEGEEEERFGDEIILAARSRDAAAPVPVTSPWSLSPQSQSHSQAGKDRPIRSSPPPLSPIPKASRSMPSVAYMIALIKMRNQQTPGQKLFAVVNDHGSSVNGGKSSGRGRRSGLRSCAWVAVSGDGDGDEKAEVEEVEEEFDSDSVADWYAALDY